MWLQNNVYKIETNLGFFHSNVGDVISVYSALQHQIIKMNLLR